MDLVKGIAMMNKQVIAKRGRDVGHFSETKKLERIGRGFVIRDVLWTEQQLRKIPSLDFEHWAVIALGGIPNKMQAEGMGINGRVYATVPGPWSSASHGGQPDFIDDWYPIQVKQPGKVGRPDIDNFETAMMRTRRKKGFFVGFDFSVEAVKEINRFFQLEQIGIVPLTVREILEQTIAQRLV